MVLEVLAAVLPAVAKARDAYSARVQSKVNAATATDKRNTETDRLVKIEQAIHSGIDFRGVVPLLFIGGLFFGPIKDGQSLLPAASVITATWLCVAGAFAAMVSIWAGTRTLRAPQQRAQSYDEELKALHRTTVRKVVSYDASLVLGMSALVAYAIGYTISVAGR